MKKAKKTKLIKIVLLLISTLFLPFQFLSTVFYFIPSIYVSLIVPYLIWKILFGNGNSQIRKYSLIWKIPIIIFLSIAMLYIELGFIFIFAMSMSLVSKIMIFIFILLLIRCATYVMMILIWQSDILLPYRKLIYIAIAVYCVAVVYLIYSVINAPDTDDYSIPFSEYISVKLML